GDVTVKRFFKGVFASLCALVALFSLGSAALASDERYSDLDGYKLSEVTLNGSHNTYWKSNFKFLTDGLNEGQVIEVDVWPDPVRGIFLVSHDTPISSFNNCYNLGNGTRNQDLRDCIDDLRQWHDRFPDHPLVIVKIEVKDGFMDKDGARAADIDRTISAAANPRL